MSGWCRKSWSQRFWPHHGLLRILARGVQPPAQGLHDECTPWALPGLVAALFEFQVKLFVARVGFRMSFAISDDFMVQLPLNLAIENLQIFIFHFSQVLRKNIGRSDPQVFFHGRPFDSSTPQIGTLAIGEVYVLAGTDRKRWPAEPTGRLLDQPEAWISLGTVCLRGLFRAGIRVTASWRGPGHF